MFLDNVQVAFYEYYYTLIPELFIDIVALLRVDLYRVSNRAVEILRASVYFLRTLQHS